MCRKERKITGVAAFRELSIQAELRQTLNTYYR